MHVRTTLAVGFCVCLIGGIWTRLDAQRSGAFRGSTEDPAIKYSSSPLNNVVVDVNRRIQDGSIQAHRGRTQRISALGSRGTSDSG